MSKWIVKFVLAGAVVALVVVAQWRASEASPASEGTAPRRRLESVEFLAPSEAPVAGALEPGADAAEAPPECTTVLRARFVDARGRPIAGALLACAYPIASTRSGADGRVELALSLRQRAPLPRLHLHAEAAGFANAAWTAQAREDAACELGEIVLGAGGVLRGRVVDETGRPVESAEVRCATDVERYANWKLQGPSLAVASGATANDGSFVLTGVPLGAARVWAGERDSFWTASEVVEVREHPAQEELVLRLASIPPGNRIDVRVLAPDGAPLADAALTIRARSAANSELVSACTDVEGRYRHVATLASVHELRASDPLGRYRSSGVIEVFPGEDEVALVLREPRWLRLTCSDEDGAPLENFQVELRSVASRASLATCAGSSPGSIALPEEPFQLEVAAEGFARAELGPFDPQTCGPALAVTLARAQPRESARSARLAGRLWLQAGTPRGWRASLWSAQEPSRELDARSLDAQGDFELLASPGETWLRLAPPDEELGELVITAVLALQEGDNAWQLDLAFGRAQGRVVSLPASARLTWRWQPDPGLWASGRVSIGADGSFLLPRLPAGKIAFVRADRAGEPPLEEIDLPARATVDVEL